jgi:probable addiction module antidote protein
MKEPIYEYDPAAALTDPETIALFISDAFQTGDAAYIAEALGVVARAKGMTDLAEASGVTRENLYRSFSAKGNPTLKTLVAVMTALGVDMIARPHTPA